MRSSDKRSSRPRPQPIDHSDMRQIAKELHLSQVVFAPLVDSSIEVRLAVTFQRESTLFPLVTELLDFVARRGRVSLEIVYREFGCTTDDSKRALGEIVDTLSAVGELTVSAEKTGSWGLMRVSPTEVGELETTVDMQTSCFLPRVSRLIARAALLKGADIDELVGDERVRLIDHESYYRPDIWKQRLIQVASRGRRKLRVFEPSVRNEILQRAGLLDTSCRVLDVQVQRYNDRINAYALIRCYLYKSTPHDRAWSIMARRYGASLPESAYGLFLTKRCREYPETLTQLLQKPLRLV
jgi:hypothetical protein